VTEPRRGLVLGAGGVLGAAWTSGALSAISELTGFEGNTSEVVLGTSAGAVLGSFIARGSSSERLARHQRLAGTDVDEVEYDYSERRALPPSPRWGTVGSPKVLAAAARHPGSVAPGVALSALLPVGRGELDPIGRLVRGGDDTEPEWPTAPTFWVVATDFETGRRTIFGAPSAPSATLSQAVMASCAIPAWYRPMEIDGRRYVDGGACSTTSADVLVKLELDEVYVLAPMASFELDVPSSPLARIERQLRRATTKRLEREAAKLEAAGTSVIMLAPGPEDLEAIGTNMMDPRRRSAVFETAERTSRTRLESLLAHRTGVRKPNKTGLQATG